MISPGEPVLTKPSSLTSDYVLRKPCDVSLKKSHEQSCSVCGCYTRKQRAVQWGWDCKGKLPGLCLYSAKENRWVIATELRGIACIYNA